MEGTPRPNRPRVLLIQDPLMDERIWEPLTGADTFTPVTANPPTGRDYLDVSAWTDRVTDWLIDSGTAEDVDAVVGTDVSTGVALRVAAERVPRGPVLLIDPPARWMTDVPPEALLERMASLIDDEGGERLLNMFTSVSEEELQAFHDTGRMSREAAESFAASLTWTAGVGHPRLIALAEEMMSRRLVPAIVEGLDLPITYEPRSLSEQIAVLGDRIHIALPEQSVTERLGMRGELQEALPEARLHPLPGQSGAPGWWEHSNEYLSLIESILRPGG